MVKRDKYEIKLERIDTCINELRALLNEICATSEGSEDNEERLIISRCLDELIVEYLKHIKSRN